MLIDIKSCHVTENALYCVVNGVFHREIHLDEVFIRTPPKEALYLDVGIAKKKKSVNISVEDREGLITFCSSLLVVQQKNMLWL